jgi:hypothetical protein
LPQEPRPEPDYFVAYGVIFVQIRALLLDNPGMENQN